MAEKDGAAYQVLARKYRPGTFQELIGQEAMIRILRNAFAEDRVSQAYMLTGVRGVGKTTTARIIAKGLNCIADGAEKAVEPCGRCESCVSVAEGRHMDVLELDAASRSQVNEMREVLENVAFEPVKGRYKVYLIDEIHMLSTHAFNALLKTLEEPPAHVKFIFATTEIRKVPVTVLSRCQRFDLKRIDPPVMRSHLMSIAKSENIPVTGEAVDLITRAAEGSARDAVSLLDQVAGQGGETIGPAEVREMLGLADRGRTLDLLELIMKGEAADALRELASQYNDGVDPLAVLRDLAEAVHLISILKVSPDTGRDAELPPDEAARGLDLAGKLPMGVLSRAWQMLLKAGEEAPNAPSPVMAAEMAVIRLCYVRDMPPAAELLEKLTSASEQAGPGEQTGGPTAAEGRTDSGRGAGRRPSVKAEMPVPDLKTEMTSPSDLREALPSSPDAPLMSDAESWEVAPPPGGQAAGAVPADDHRLQEAERHELSQSVIKSFPGAVVQVLRP